jgi:hypothetical protein
MKMIHAILLWCSSFKTNKYFGYGSMVAWILYMLLGTNFSYGYFFPIMNMMIFLGTILLVRVSKKARPILSAGSVLLYSVLIDIVCYFMYPDFTMGQSMLEYIWSGICFNYKAVIIPIIFTLYYTSFVKLWQKLKIHYANQSAQSSVL